MRKIEAFLRRRIAELRALHKVLSSSPTPRPEDLEKLADLIWRCKIGEELLRRVRRGRDHDLGT